MEAEQVALRHIETIVFDVIGTLVDEDETLREAANRLATDSGAGSPEEFLQRWVRLLDRRMQAVISGDALWQSHSSLVSESADEAIISLGGTPTLETSDLAAHLERNYRAWPDVADATATLRRNRLVVGLSNGDLESLARLSNTNAISWDIALSTGAAGTFKPDPRAYHYAIDTLDLDPERTLFVAAHPWDLRAAAKHGFRTGYLARPGATRPTEEDRFDLLLDDLKMLPNLLL